MSTGIIGGNAKWEDVLFVDREVWKCDISRTARLAQICDDCFLHLCDVLSLAEGRFIPPKQLLSKGAGEECFLSWVGQEIFPNFF